MILIMRLRTIRIIDENDYQLQGLSFRKVITIYGFRENLNL